MAHYGKFSGVQNYITLNQQKFLFTLKDNCVLGEATGGVYSKVDLGIVKYHFETGAGADHFTWT